MNVLLIGNDFHSIYYTRKELIQELAKKHTVYCAVPWNNQNDKLEILGCKIVPLEMSRMGTNPWQELRTLRKIRKLLRELAPDVIYTFTIKPNIYTGILMRHGKRRQVVTITGLGRAFQQDNLRKRIIIVLYRFAFQNVKQVIFENSENEQIFARLGIALERHLVVSGAGVNLMEHSVLPYPDEKNGIHLLFVGRMERDKGFLELLEAATYYESQYAMVDFTVLGTCEKSFEEEFKQLKIPNNMKLEGWQMNVEPYMRRSHAVVLPSYHEGMANVLLEAAAAARPILASRIHGCIESFEEGISGIGFARKSSVELIEAINKFLAMTPEKRRLMGEAGRRKMEKEFDRRIVVKTFSKQLGEEKR